MAEKLWFYIRHSFNDLRVNRQRTLFALLCIAAGVAAIVSLQQLGVMIEDTLTGNLQESNRGDIRVSTEYNDPDDNTGDFSQEELESGENQGVVASGGSFEREYITQHGLQVIRDWLDEKFPGQVEMTYRQVESEFDGTSISLPAKDTDKMPVLAYIVDGDQYPFYGEVETDDGKTLDDMLQGPTDIVLSQNLADDLNAEVGDVVRLVGSPADYTVRGIVPTDSESGFENAVGALFGYYYIDLSATQNFSSVPVGAEIVYLKLDDPAMLQKVSRAFQLHFHFLNTFTTEDLKDQNADISKYLNQLVIIMGLVSLLIGGIGIVNTMLVIVSRRTTEVAVLKTIGLEGAQVTVLFMVEAVIMGIFGSLLGIAIGWVAAYLIKGVAGAFLAQTLVYRITPQPAVVGFIVGVLVTTIFGFLPTLAAGQVRPNFVMRPSDTFVPKAGRLRTFVAVLVMLLALSVVAQGLVRDLLDSDQLRSVGEMVGAILGALIGWPMLVGGLMLGWTRRKTVLRVLRWGLFGIGLPLLGYLFGDLVPAVLILFFTFLLVGILYVLLWTLIWSVAGGSLSELWFLKLHRHRNILLQIPIVLLSLPIWILNAALIIVMVPFWLLGQVIRRLAFVDLKLALRSMWATKGRGASTLLALVVGVFTLSLITMLAKAITNKFEEIIVDETGGNMIVFTPGTADALDRLNERFASLDGVKSYAVVGTYESQLVRWVDVSEDRTYGAANLRGNLALNDEEGDELSFEFLMSAVDARDVTSNLPDVDLYKGRQLTPEDDGKPYIVLSVNQAMVDAGFDVGDEVTFQLSGAGSLFGGENDRRQEMTFTIVGLLDRRNVGITLEVGAFNYAPRGTFPEGFVPTSVNAVVDVEEDQIRTVRRSLNELPSVFVLETRLLNDLINRVIDQFTSFPILVAALALFTGGVVIANSVALSTMERRREIAVMKAVGLRRERVLGMLLMEYGVMGLIGGLIGVGLGGAILLMMLVQMFGGELGRSIPYFTAFGLMSLCVGIALVAAILTAWGASGEKPLNVLRYE